MAVTSSKQTSRQATRSLSPKEAHLLVSDLMDQKLFFFFPQPLDAEKRYLAISLEAKGILEKDYTLLISYMFLLSAIVATMFYANYISLKS